MCFAINLFNLLKSNIITCTNYFWSNFYILIYLNLFKVCKFFSKVFYITLERTTNLVISKYFIF